MTIARRLTPMVLWSTGLYGMYTYLGVGLTAAGYSSEGIGRAIMAYMELAPSPAYCSAVN